MPPLNYNGRVINAPCDKANIFNMYLESQTQLNVHGKEAPHLDPPTNLLNITQLIKEEITANLKSLEIGKACDPGYINNRIHQATAENIIVLIVRLKGCLYGMI